MLRLFVLFGILCFTACTTRAPVATPEIRTQQAENLVKKAGWQEHTIHASTFTLKAYGQHAKSKTETLRVFIEGDGLAWLSEDTPSDNPTPANPMALKMALHDRHHAVAYLARPCQFVFNKEWGTCQQAYWTQLRFSPQVIQAMNQALDQMKKYYHAEKIILIGYSGGGTVAALIAARRNDVVKLVTVAAVLDTKKWTDMNSLTPLYGSLDPADEWSNLISIPQTHWVGGNDLIAPKDIAFAFANHFPAAHKPDIKIIPEFDHACCWATIDL